MADNRLTLKAGGTEYSIWRDKLVEKSMLTPLHSFYFVLNAAISGQISDFKLAVDTECTVALEDETVVTGIIEDIIVERKLNSNSRLQISGRESICSAWDSFYQESTVQWKDQTILNNIKNVLKPFDITVDTDSAAQGELNKTIPVYTASPLVTVGDQVTKLCQMASVLPMSNGDGRLYLGRGTTSDYCTDSIEMGNNAHESFIRISNQNRASVNRIIGQGVSAGNTGIADFQQPHGSFNDGQVRERFLTMYFDGIADSGFCRNMAKWQGRMRAGMSRAVTYRVAGWTQSDGTPWSPNTLVKIKDEEMEIRDTRLIMSVEYFLHNRTASMTDITVVPKDTFSFSTNQINVKMKGFDAGI